MKKVVYVGKTRKFNRKVMGYKTPYEMRRTRWIFHQYDKDDFPSVPHGHNDNNTLKLDANNGIIYNKNRQQVGKISKKELERLHKDKKFIELQSRAKEHYEMQFKTSRKLVQKRGYNNIRYAVDVTALHNPQRGVVGYARTKTNPNILKDNIFIFETNTSI